MGPRKFQRVSVSNVRGTKLTTRRMFVILAVQATNFAVTISAGWMVTPTFFATCGVFTMSGRVTNAMAVRALHRTREAGANWK